MTSRERLIIILILLFTAIFVAMDLLTDSRVGVKWWHLLVEGTVALAALSGVIYLLRGSFSLKKNLEAEKLRSKSIMADSELWRQKAKSHLAGLASEIDKQLVTWGLTAAEKEVAFLLLKGLSLKEIASIRETSEKTARAQSIAIYEKSGLSGRSELAAFFLEDLLLPIAK